MKRFTKLAAVFAALMLSLACFVACSNGDDSSSAPTGGSASTGNSGSGGSATVLEGLWISDDFYGGYYFVGNKVYSAYRSEIDGRYYYNTEGREFAIFGNQFIDDGQTLDFTISGNTLFTKMEVNTDYGLTSEITSFKKIEKTPTGVSAKEFDAI